MCLRLYWLCYGVTLVWVILLDYCREAHRMWPWMTKLPLKMKNGAWLKGLMVGWWEWWSWQRGAVWLQGRRSVPGVCVLLSGYSGGLNTLTVLQTVICGSGFQTWFDSYTRSTPKSVLFVRFLSPFLLPQLTLFNHVICKNKINLTSTMFTVLLLDLKILPESDLSCFYSVISLISIILWCHWDTAKGRGKNILISGFRVFANVWHGVDVCVTAACRLTYTNVT